MSSDFNKKYKIPKKKTLATTNPETSTSRIITANSEGIPIEHVCPLLAKDSEWVDILQVNEPGSAKSPHSSHDGDASEEEVLQLVECEDGPRMRPLAIMFPGLLDKDPQTLNGMLNRAMSTTEVTRQLVDLGQKANFEFMKKADRLIPPDKLWLESVSENSNSVGSLCSSTKSGCPASYSSSCEASNEISIQDAKTKRKKKLSVLSKMNPSLVLQESTSNQSNETTDEDPSNKRN